MPEVSCPKCGGKGYNLYYSALTGTERPKCIWCYGTGRIEEDIAERLNKPLTKREERELHRTLARKYLENQIRVRKSKEK